MSLFVLYNSLFPSLTYSVFYIDWFYKCISNKHNKQYFFYIIQSKSINIQSSNIKLLTLNVVFLYSIFGGLLYYRIFLCFLLKHFLAINLSYLFIFCLIFSVCLFSPSLFDNNFVLFDSLSLFSYSYSKKTL